MSVLLRRLASAGVGGLLFVMLLTPVAVQASTSKVSSVTSAHIARTLALAPRGVTHWTIVSAPMSQSSGPKNTVYGNCGSAWMAIGNQGGGHAWIALGWDIYYAAYAEYWATGVAPAGSRAGSGGIPPWNSHSWDTGYSSWEGYWVWAGGWAYMVAYLYPFQGPSACVSNGPTAWAFITP